MSTQNTDSVPFTDPFVTPLCLADVSAWDVFVEWNRDALIEQYGSVENALKVCRDGGLVLGGGAAPAVHIYFAP